MEAQLIAPDKLAHVPEHIRLVLAQVKRELVDYYGDRIQKLILFGSYARGDFHGESDIDLMPIVDGTSKDDLRLDGLFDITYLHLLQNSIKVSIAPSLADQYECSNTFLLMFVQKDGVEL